MSIHLNKKPITVITMHVCVCRCTIDQGGKHRGWNILHTPKSFFIPHCEHLDVCSYNLC